ncbi:MAG: protein-L-isoaspartate(D-aspartate) O-methyltransferase [bacterium]|nr:protein-L-isoaspartate(D-aspartate) O-methyltransferase [bacterium]
MPSLQRSEENGYVGARRRLVERLREQGVRDPRVLEAVSEVRRHLLVDEALRDRAYEDVPLPIGDGQTISAPGIVAAMSEALELQGHETVLEVGTGSGYQAAILSRLAARVISIERIPGLANRARSALDMLGVTNVVVHLGDGSRGRPSEAPFDAIVVTAGGPKIPEPLVEQLVPGGRLVGPFGPRGQQELIRVRRKADGELVRESLGLCRFVDLVGEHGWMG